MIRVVYVGIHDEVEVAREPGSDLVITCARGVPVEVPDEVALGRTETVELDDGRVVTRQTHGGLLDQPDNWQAAPAEEHASRARRKHEDTHAAPAGTEE